LRTGRNGCRWVCAGGRRLNLSDDVPEAARTPPDANATEMHIVDMSSVELERAGCRWFCTGRNGCRWVCAGGRRLNISDGVPEAVRAPPDENATDLRLVDISSVELERAGCRWLCTGRNGCHWVCAGGRRLNISDDVPEAARTSPDANATELNQVEISSVELERAGCRWFCTGRNGCRWVCAGGRRLNISDDVPETVRAPPEANMTEVNIVEIASIELERAGCRWLCTGRNGCRWVCAGGRRLNISDDVPGATSTPPDANAAEMNHVETSSVELERAGCTWLCTGRNGCRWVCAGGRRLETAEDEQLSEALTVADDRAKASIQSPTFVLV